jgi:hypothetical protein
MPALLLNYSRLKQAIALTKPLKQALHVIAELKQAIALTKPLKQAPHVIAELKHACSTVPLLSTKHARALTE